MLTSVETELTTAATDALLGLVCLALALGLVLLPDAAPWKRNVWLAVLLLMAVGSVLGAVAHGLVLREATRSALWKPLYLSLGLAVALVAVGAVYDGWGEAWARRLLPWAVAAGLAFFAASQWMGGAFAIFIAYEAVATVAALAIYVTLAMRGALPGAALMAGGIALSLVAAVVQLGPWSLRIGVRFDHNGLFHLLQTVAVLVLAAGVRAGLRP